MLHWGGLERPIATRGVADPQEALRDEVERVCRGVYNDGYQRLQVLLQREGWSVNHKRDHRLYRRGGLILRMKLPRRRVACVKREEPHAAKEQNACWSMNFVSDQVSCV